MSLRSRLTAITSVAVAAVVVVVSLSCWWLMRGRLYQQLDARLRTDAVAAQQAATPAAAAAAMATATQPRADWRSGPAAPDVAVRFLDTAGIVVAQSAGAQVLGPVAPAAQEVSGSGQGAVLTDAGSDEHSYRVDTVARPGGAVEVARRTGGIAETLTGLGALLIGISLAGVAVAGLIGWTIARAGLSPVERLTTVIEEIARTQDVTAGIPVRGHDEIARLAVAFNGMLTALAGAKAAQRQLVEDAGHELRTPLTGLRNNIELLIHASQQAPHGRAMPAEDQTRLLADLGAQVAELSTLTGELIDLAADDANPEPFEQLALAGCVDAAVVRARIHWPSVVFDLDVLPATCAGQPAALERAVLNLLDNAAKWSPPGGVVRVVMSVNEAGDHADLVVGDDGPGIAEEDREKVFQRFYRAADARAMPGSGLGLAIVAKTVEAHHGSVHAARAESGGAELRIRLPLSASHRKTAAVS
ncbi:HAMP domain-containing histidine kinase [Amycolatopsis acidiphila]|uniref:histidine kinase n=1 Tax=Amycolatopsis acidiphila TaxID=715473 RepID=A0A558AJ88_9PSEU|nr:HAMP domain-containing sensor histidine kinase [Amycolatopsis acidiphila]TVT24327.1 HAMP domain-containing histidine kinase [Amycolatopsis acidiphila]UIJ62539.1 HAMP domain-containing histidine kinase [Amycolatopsis acidiphila]GHG85286.1 two-component sensor histidine kinase [Amycolatopsis acidiphila]